MPADADNSPEETTDTEQLAAPKESPLEAIRRAQANRVPPPTGGGKGGKGGKGRGGNPSQIKRFNRGG
jgi:hypothetical protein